MRFQPKRTFEKPCFWSLTIMISQDLPSSEISHFEFLIGHSLISSLKDPMVKFKKIIQKNKMNSLI